MLVSILAIGFVLEELDLQIDISSVVNIGSYLRYMYKEMDPKDGSMDHIPEELQMLYKQGEFTNNQNCFLSPPQEVAKEFTDKPSANAFKSAKC